MLRVAQTSCSYSFCPLSRSRRLTAKLLKGTDNASKLLKYKEKRIAEGEEDTARAQSLTDFRVMTGNYRSQKGPIFESNVMQTVVRIKFV